MFNYMIQKLNNGEYNEVNKNYILDVQEYCKDRTSLYFNVEGEELPALFDIDVFYSILVSQIQTGLMEKMSFKDGIITTIVRDGNVIVNSTYDFRWQDFSNRSELGFSLENALDDLKSLIYKVVSLYNNDPNRALTTEKRYIRMLCDIMDGDRIPKLDNDELMRVFQVYNANKSEILGLLLENVIFFDENDNVLEYRPFLRKRKLDLIKYEVLEEMEKKMLMFSVANNAYDKYQEYLQNIYIPTVEIEFVYVDENGNQIDPSVEEVEPGTIMSLGREFFYNMANNIKDFTTNKYHLVKDKVKEMKRTK